jgi:tetratricopeptide (TPR) repeat protein
MGKLGNLLMKGFLLLLILFALAHTSFAKEGGATNVARPPNQQVLQGPYRTPLTHEDIVIEAQRGVDRSIDILRLVASLIIVLVGLLAINMTTAIAFGIFEYRRLRGTIKEIEEDAKIVKGIRNKAREDAEELRSEIGKISRPPLAEEPTGEIKGRFDEFSRRLEILELLGVSLKPEDYINRGFDLYYKGKYEEALKAFNTVIELKPDFANSWYYKGLALGGLDRYEEALRAHERAIALEPDYTNAWVNKGVALDNLGRYEEALKAYDKVIGLNPDFAEAWGNKGITLIKVGRYEEALKAYDKVIGLKPDFALAWYDRAGIYSIKKKKDKALSDLKKAIELDASYKEKAKTDEDFKNLRKEGDFKSLVE